MNAALLILVLNLSAADPLIVISPKRGAAIGLHSTRPQFVSFRVEFLPDGPPTNLITLAVTNDLLRVEDLPQVPSGQGLMGVRAVFADGEESEVALSWYYLHRNRPSAPSVTPVAIGTTNEVESSLSDEIRKIQRRRVIPAPPMPPGVVSDAELATVPTEHFIRPLPDATNRAYSQYLDSLADRSAKGLRRNE